MATGVNDVEQLDNVGVLYFLEQRNLGDGGARNTLIFRLQSEFLQSDNMARMVQLAGLIDDTVRA